MRTTLAVCMVIAFLALLTMGLVARGSRNIVSKTSDTLAADRAGIEKLRKADIDATLTQEPSALTTLWSDDGVNLQGPAGPVVGLKALGELYAKFRVDHPKFEVLKYSPEFKSHERTDFYRRFAGGFARNECSPRQRKYLVRSMQLLQRLHLQGFSVSRWFWRLGT
jgi:hypothetical protein